VRCFALTGPYWVRRWQRRRRFNTTKAAWSAAGDRVAFHRAAAHSLLTFDGCADPTPTSAALAGGDDLNLVAGRRDGSRVAGLSLRDQTGVWVWNARTATLDDAATIGGPATTLPGTMAWQPGTTS